MDEEVNHVLLGIGSVLVALSGTIVGIYAFKDALIEVIFGYMVFVLGYKTCWYAVNKKIEGSNLFNSINFESKLDQIKSIEPWKYLLIVIGVYLAAHGTVEFGAFVSEPKLLNGVEAGLSTFAGYIIAHEGVNEVPL